jgi:hypothetical protein
VANDLEPLFVDARAVADTASKRRRNAQSQERRKAKEKKNDLQAVNPN